MIASENPYSPPRYESDVPPQPTPPPSFFAFFSKWFRLVLACSAIASVIAASITLNQFSHGSYLGRTIVQGQLTFGAIALAILIVAQIVHVSMRYSFHAQMQSVAPNKSLHPTAATSGVMESQLGGG